MGAAMEHRVSYPTGFAPGAVKDRRRSEFLREQRAQNESEIETIRANLEDGKQAELIDIAYALTQVVTNYHDTQQDAYNCEATLTVTLTRTGDSSASYRGRIDYSIKASATDDQSYTLWKFFS